MKIITQASIEPITLATARKQCKVDAELVGSPPELAHEDDELISLFITTAREWVEAYLGLRVAQTGVQIALDAFDGSISLEEGPVLYVSSITYLDPDTGSELVVDSSIYELDTNDQIAVVKLRADQEWPDAKSGTNSIKVNYVIGYSAEGDSPQDAPLPKSIKTAILLLVAHLYKNREASTEKSLSEIPMGVTFFLSPIKLRRGFA